MAVAWRFDNDAMHLDLKIPPGVNAVVRLPDGQESRVEEGDHAFRCTVG